MKKIKLDLKGAPIFILVEVVVAVVVCAALIGGVIVPGFNSWMVVSAENKASRDRLANVEKNIQEISALDSDQTNSLKTFLDSYLPDKQDALPFFILLEKLAVSTGVRISVGQYETAGGTAVPAAGTGQVPTAATPTPTNATSFTARSTVDGKYENLERFLEGLKTINRIVNITNMTIDSSGEDLSLALVLSAPLFGTPPATKAEVLISLTQTEIEELQKIVDDVEVTASPNEKPVGRTNPF